MMSRITTIALLSWMLVAMPLSAQQGPAVEDALRQLDRVEASKDADSATAPAAATSAAEDSDADAPEPTKPATIARIRMTGQVLNSPPAFALFASKQDLTMHQWLKRLAAARNDQAIHAVALEIDTPTLTLPQAVELADAIKRLDRVKPVYTYLMTADMPHYLVASAGRKVFLEPTGDLAILGISAEVMFFGGTLDAVGIQPQFVQVGRFKGAAEPMIATGPSEEMKGEMNALLDDLYAQIVSQIARARSLNDQTVRAAIDEAPLAADAARKHKLVDALVTRGQWKRAVEAELSDGGNFTWANNYAMPASADVDLSNPFAVLGALMTAGAEARTKDPTIAIVHADGVITAGASGSSLLGGRTVGARTLERTFARVEENDAIRAVVFRIDSPGGSALASEMIYQAVARCAAAKPVIVSIGSVGASGGYYIAAPGRTIYADEPALVGSIGVVAGKLAIEGLLEKLHLRTWRLARGANAGLMSSRPWTPREVQVIRTHAERTYDQFVSRVQAHRAKAIPDIDAVAQGRIFTARQAKKVGLVDEVGGLASAVDAARDAAGLEGHVNYIVLPRAQTLREVLTGQDDEVRSRLLGAVGGEAALRALLDRTGQTGKRAADNLAYLLTLADLLGRETVLMARPYALQVSP